MSEEIVIIGEAWGQKEEELGRPFVGPSGYLLDQMLSHAGIDRRDCYLTNVFNLRPRPSNDVKNLCGPKAEGIPGMPALVRGKYAKREYACELDRLYREISDRRPNVLLCLGATASWALLRSTGIKSIRGSTALVHPAVAERIGYEAKVLPTYHPAAVMRQWTLRPIVIADFEKAKRQSYDKSFSRPSRNIWVRPTLEDLALFEREHISSASLISVDIETKQNQITCIGFAPSGSDALVVPFYSEPGKSYWNREEEIVAWQFVRSWLAKCNSVYQNGLYDLNFLWSQYGIPAPRASEDTMLLHHAMQPEMEKGLGFLASLYTEEASWKFMRKGKMDHD